MPIYIIEHLEKKLWKWCLIEYKHISEIVGKDNLWFTNVKRSKALASYGKIIKSSVSNLNLKKACILDPDAEKTLTPDDDFDYFIFGGILGDFPRRRRTKRELTRFMPDAEKRNIGKKQFSTDGAVYVVKRIASGTPLEKLKFKDKIEIPVKKGESIIFPFRYNLFNGKPLISEELVKYLKRRKGF